MATHLTDTLLEKLKGRHSFSPPTPTSLKFFMIYSLLHQGEKRLK